MTATWERDRLALAARWGALAVCLLLAASAGRHIRPASVLAVVVLLVLSLVQTALPVGSTRWPGTALLLVAPAVAVAATGGARSPFLPALLPSVLDGGLRGGPRLGALVALTGPAAVIAGGGSAAGAAAVGLQLGLVAVLAARTRVLQLGTEREEALERANVLLTELHRVSQSLPASLDLPTVVRTATAQVQRLLKAESVVISVDPSSPPEDVDPELWCSVVPLRAHGRTVGYLALSRVLPLTVEERVALDDLAGQLGLALDNARWFGRVRAIAAQEERTRIARELHDRLGQDLAALGFELDAASMPELADTVRGLTRRLRHSLDDLRTEVDDDHDLGSGLATFLARVESRSGLRASLRLAAGPRPPMNVERELLRVAQEAVTNVERHAQARRLSVVTRREQDWLVLEVSDDGIGMAVSPDDAVSQGRYGVLGMRERAESVGGRVTVHSQAGRGTVVRCAVPLTVRAWAARAVA
jgi:signal transduction histidine kinase